MKLSVSLSEDDVAFVDEYARRRGASSRSSLVHRAIELLRMADLEAAYADAWDEWEPGDAANRAAERNGRGVVTVVPITSNTTRVDPFQVLVAAGEGGLTVTSKARAEQVRSVDYQRLRHQVGVLRPATLTGIDQALRTHLAL